MTRTAHILAALAVATAAASARADGPVTFARSGRPADVTVPGDAGDVVLSAFGRTWTRSVPGARGAARVSVPKVRTTTVFDVVTVAGEKKIGQLVAYPARDVKWDKSVNIAAGAEPKWFRQWAGATGLPVQWLEANEIRTWRSNRRPKKRPALLVLGRQAAGAAPAPLLRARADALPNVLVLEARWFGSSRRNERPVSIGLARMAGPLSPLRRQHWALLPSFIAPQTPWPGICNRRTWIGGDPDPLVEAISAGPSPRRVVVSYVRWEQQLGRNESADRLLLAVLRAAAVGANDRADARLVYPAGDEVDADARPILAAATAAGDSVRRWRAPPLLVVDLRGEDATPPNMVRRLGGLEWIVHAGSPLLILGDDPVLDQCKWLKIDRRKRRAAAAHVTWLAADALPPAAHDRIALMQTLTALNVSLGGGTRENTDEDQTDD